jgi:hypothetical protein
LAITRQREGLGTRGRISPFFVRHFLVENSGMDGASDDEWRAPTLYTVEMLAAHFGVKVKAAEANILRAWREAPGVLHRVRAQAGLDATVLWGAYLLERRTSRPQGSEYRHYCAPVAGMQHGVGVVLTQKSNASSMPLRCAQWRGEWTTGIQYGIAGCDAVQKVNGYATG